jgi:hypothetical protein
MTATLGVVFVRRDRRDHKKRAAGRPNWVVGSGGDRMNKVMSRMYAKGDIGPLWEKLIP